MATKPRSAQISAVPVVWRLDTSWLSARVMLCAIRVGRRGISPVFAQTVRYAARAAAGEAAPPAPFMETTPSVSSPAPVPVTTDPVGVAEPVSCPVPVVDMVELAQAGPVVGPSQNVSPEPTEAETRKTSEMVPAELSAKLDVDCGGTSESAPPTGIPDQASETLTGSESDSMEDRPTGVELRPGESMDWFDQVPHTLSGRQSPGLAGLSEPTESPAPSTVNVGDTPSSILTVSEPPLPITAGFSVDPPNSVPMATSCDVDVAVVAAMRKRPVKPGKPVKLLRRLVLNQSRGVGRFSHK